MKLTDEQFNALLPYEKTFETMVRSRWARNPGSSALDLMNEIYEKATGTRNKLNKGCQHCIIRLITDLGNIFLADYNERQKAFFEMEKQVAPIAETPAPVAPAPEKPKKKTTKKKKADETH